MTKVYKVFSIQPQQAECTVLVAGKPVTALIDATIAQLIPVHDDGSGTIKISVDSEHVGLFAIDSLVNITFASGD